MYLLFSHDGRGCMRLTGGYRSLAHHDSILGNREEDKACTWDYMDDYNYDIGSNLGNDASARRKSVHVRVRC